MSRIRRSARTSRSRPTARRYTPLQILAGASTELRVDLIEHTSERVVGWNPSAGALAFQALEGPAPMVMGSVNQPTLTVAAAGSRARAELGIKGLQLPLADVVAVEPGAVDHLELTALFYDGGASGMFPVGIEAHALDAAGKHILGLPVEWRVLAGDLVLDLGEDKQPSDVAGLLECIPKKPKTTRSGVIEARYDGHTAELELTWQGYEGDEVAYNAGPCEEGCGCRGGSPSGWAGLGIGLLALGLRRRRRSLARA